MMVYDTNNHTIQVTYLHQNYTGLAGIDLSIHILGDLGD
jgi:hypothetical protein